MSWTQHGGPAAQRRGPRTMERASANSVAHVPAPMGAGSKESDVRVSAICRESHGGDTDTATARPASALGPYRQ
ncbi:hypothetical protein BDW62DRAFT_176337 [Aspergillus aurantiobrunneus]